MRLVVRRLEGETWREAAIRYGRNWNLEDEVASAFDGFKELGFNDEDAAFEAVFEWDAFEVERPKRRCSSRPRFGLLTFKKMMYLEYGRLAKDKKLLYRIVPTDGRRLRIEVFTVGKWRFAALARKDQVRKTKGVYNNLGIAGGMSDALFEEVIRRLHMNGGMPFSGKEFRGFVLEE